MTQVYVKTDTGRYKPAELDTMLSAVSAALDAKYNPPDQKAVRCPDDIGPELVARCGHLEHEILGMVWMDNQLRIIQVDDAFFRGTINQAGCYPRELVKRALELNAANCIMFHNHPSGSTVPSEQDIGFTNGAAMVLDVIGCPLRDHLIVAAGKYQSLLPVNIEMSNGRSFDDALEYLGMV